MQLTDLPEEIFILIIQDLDFFSKHSLYNTCKFTRNLVCMRGVIKKCDLSCRVMATAHSFKLKFFKDIAQHIVELNMRGAPDLCKTIFIPAVKKLKSLKKLDISYTKLDLLDLIDIYKACPTLKDITINFYEKSCLLTPQNITEFQSLFQNFENIHIIDFWYDLLYVKVSKTMLAKSRFHTLTYTLPERRTCEYYYSCNLKFYDQKFPQFRHFKIYLHDWHYKTKDLITYVDGNFVLPNINLDLRNYEYVIINMGNYEFEVYASAIFKDFFMEEFNIALSCPSQHGLNLLGNVIIMLWDRNLVDFDANFYHALAKNIKPHFPYYFNVQSEPRLSSAAAKYNWFFTHPIPRENNIFKHIPMYQGIKKRLVAPKFVLDYDEIFKNKSNVELSLVFKHPLINTIALNGNCSYLRKLTYLSLVQLPRHECDFFKVLFQYCVNLETLNVESGIVTPCALSISRFLSLSKSIKNIRLLERFINFNELFLSFSQCQTLENIYVIDKALNCNDEINPSILLEKCFRLHSIFLGVQMCIIGITNLRQQFKKCKVLYKRLYLDVIVTNDSKNIYTQFGDVFKMNSVKSV